MSTINTLNRIHRRFIMDYRDIEEQVLQLSPENKRLLLDFLLSLKAQQDEEGNEDEE